MLCTQGNVLEDSNSSIMPFGLTQAERHTKSKPRFAEFACSVEEVSSSLLSEPDADVSVKVFRYVTLITEVVIPKAFWGSDANLRVLHQCGSL